MSKFYSEGSNCTSGSSSNNSKASSSSSNPQEHSHVPSTNVGVIIPSAYNYNPTQVPIQFPPKTYIPPGFAPKQPAPFFSNAIWLWGCWWH